VCGVPDQQVNEQVAAVVVLESGGEADEGALREFARTALAPYKVPTLIEYRTELPLTKGGKVSRAELARELSASTGGTAPSPTPTTRSDEPRTLTEKRLVEIWERILGRSAIGIHDDFFALGGQSLDNLSLLSVVNESFRSAIEPLHLFDRANTIARMAKFLDNAVL